MDLILGSLVKALSVTALNWLSAKSLEGGGGHRIEVSTPKSCVYSQMY